jgi:hypothetical protein
MSSNSCDYVEICHVVEFDKKKCVYSLLCN